MTLLLSARKKKNSYNFIFMFWMSKSSCPQLKKKYFFMKIVLKETIRVETNFNHIRIYQISAFAMKITHILTWLHFSYKFFIYLNLFACSILHSIIVNPFFCISNETIYFPHIDLLKISKLRLHYDNWWKFIQTLDLKVAMASMFVLQTTCQSECCSEWSVLMLHNK